MDHVCTQTRRLFIVERDITAESAKHQENLQQIHDVLLTLSRELGNLGHNMSRELQSLRREVAALSKTIKRHQ